MSTLRFSSASSFKSRNLTHGERLTVVPGEDDGLHAHGSTTLVLILQTDRNLHSHGVELQHHLVQHLQFAPLDRIFTKHSLGTLYRRICLSTVIDCDCTPPTEHNTSTAP